MSAEGLNQSASAEFKKYVEPEDLGDEGVDTEQVQAMNASEHAGGRDADGNVRDTAVAEVNPDTAPITVPEEAVGAASTRVVDQHQDESGQPDEDAETGSLAGSGNTEPAASGSDVADTDD
jgi:hypothetical protein